jgi:WD40 repeat protein
MQGKSRRPFSKSEWLLLLAPLLVLAGFGFYAVLRPLFPRVLRGHGDRIGWLKFSPGGERLLVFSSVPATTTRQTEKNRKITLWDVASQYRLLQEPASSGDVQFTSDGTAIITRNSDPIARIEQNNSPIAQTLQLIPKPRQLALTKQNFLITIENLREREKREGKYNELVTVRNAESGSTVWRAKKEGGEFGDKAYDLSPNNKIFAAFENEENIRLAKYKYYLVRRPVVWRFSSDVPVQSLPASGWETVEFISDDTILLGEVQKANASYPLIFDLKTWDWQSGRQPRVLKTQAAKWCLSSNKKQIVVLKKLSHIKEEINPDGPPDLSIIGSGGEFSMMSLPDGKTQWKATTKNDVYRIYIDDHARFLLSLESEIDPTESSPVLRYKSRAVLRDGGSGKILSEYSKITATAISPDGQTVATGDAKGVVRLYDTRRFLH